ncbi:hypothetical protein IAT38_004182 [Cryptococcus sp. DSM 104549]
MGIFNRKSNEYAADGTPMTHGTHHPGRDAALAGAAAHHESNTHAGRNTALAAGGVGATQHHRNNNEINGTSHGPLGHPTGQGVTGTGTSTNMASDGYGGVGGTGTGTTGGGMTGAGTGAGVGAGTAAGAGATGTHTGPAPLHGVNTTGAAPSAKAANKLDKKSKMESTMGSLLCSSSLKQKSATHHAQADHMRMQASELTQAEKLEHEAGLRRQRAVGLGADPMHATGTTGHGPSAMTA